MVQRRGWFNESHRHSLASKGIKTSVNGESIRQQQDLISSLHKPAKKKGHGSYLAPEQRFEWASVYDAPVSLITRDFKQMYGREPTSEELNDILLEGRY